MKRIVLLLISIVLVSNSVLAEKNTDKNSEYLKEYVNLGLKKNLDLQSSREMLGTYDAKVSQASANFMPKLDVNGRFTRAGGGRSFIFPLGTMMNPLYIKDSLPNRLQDEEVPFMRPQEQDTKLELIQPLFNLAIYHNYKSQDNFNKGAQYEFKAKELNTVNSIKEAYYNYAKALQVVEIRKSALKLGEEAYQTAKNLFDADKVPRTDVLRSEVSLSTMKQELQAAQNNSKLAGNYFNNILYRELETPINFSNISIEDINNSDVIKKIESEFTLEKATENALALRPEIRQYEYSLKAMDCAKSAVSSDYFPSLALAVDYGFQGENYVVDSKAFYWMASAVLKWNLFSGFETHAKEQEMKAQLTSMEIGLENIKQMIKLDVKNNYINLINNLEQLKVGQKSYESARENFDLNKRRYEEGLNTFINLLDAEMSYNFTKENYIITYFDILNSKAKLERSIGLTDF